MLINKYQIQNGWFHQNYQNLGNGAWVKKLPDGFCEFTKLYSLVQIDNETFVLEG